MIGYKQGVRDTLTRYGLIRRSPPSFFAVFAFGAGIGLIAGAAAAVLMTPSTGRDMRRELGWRAKKLAERTQAAAREIEALVSTIQSDTNEAVITMDEQTAEVEREARVVSSAGTELERIRHSITESAMLISAMNTAARERHACFWDAPRRRSKGPPTPGVAGRQRSMSASTRRLGR